MKRLGSNANVLVANDAAQKIQSVSPSIQSLTSAKPDNQSRHEACWSFASAREIASGREGAAPVRRSGTLAPPTRPNVIPSGQPIAQGSGFLNVWVSPASVLGCLRRALLQWFTSGSAFRREQDARCA